MKQSNDKDKGDSIILTDSTDVEIDDNPEVSLCYDTDPCAGDTSPCMCLFGDLADEPLKDKFYSNNPMNEHLIQQELNYFNIDVVVGNCKHKGKMKYWIRTEIVLSNKLDEYGLDHYNCMYDVTTKLSVDGGGGNSPGSTQATWERPERVNLVQDVKDESNYLGVPKTQKLSEVWVINQDYCPSTINIELCANRANLSTQDGVSTYEQTQEDITWNCECCRTFEFHAAGPSIQELMLDDPSQYPEYRDKYFVSYCSEEAGPCMVCDKEKYLQNENFQLFRDNNGKGELLYTADIVDTCLIYMEADPSPFEIGKTDPIRGYIAHGHGESNRTHSDGWNVVYDGGSADTLNVTYGPSEHEVQQHTTK